MSVFGIGSPTALSPSILQLNRELQDLQVQLGTGRKAQTYSGLGSDRTLALDLRGEISKLEGFQRTIQTVSLRTEVAGQALERIDEMLADSRSSLALTEFQSGVGGQTIAQFGALEKVQEMVALLNSEVSGAHLFSGRDSDKRPVLSADAIMDGQGAKDGLRTVVAQRLAADTGPDGRGRLSLAPAAAGVVGLAEDGAGHPFGLKISGVDSNLGGTATAGPSGSPAALTVTFGGTLPAEGQRIAVDFDLPDGSSETLTLTATTVSPPDEGEFLVGADATETGDNFRTALDAAIGRLVATSVSAASLVQAGTEFFEFDAANPPRRVDGPPYDTATALVDATASDTVFWYAGEAETSDPRGSVVARIDDGYTLKYGMRANEAALRNGLKFTALLAVVEFDGTLETEEVRYAEVKERLAPGFLTANGQANVREIATELALKSQVLNSTKTRHETAVTLAQTTLDETEGVDLDEVGARILALQTHLQASYQATSILSRLSLLEFL